MARTVWHLLESTKHSDESLWRLQFDRETRHKRRKHQTRQSHSNSRTQKSNSIQLLSHRRSSGPWWGVIGKTHHHQRYFVSIVGVRFLFDENQSNRSSYNSLANGDNAFMQHAAPHYFRSVGLFRTSDSVGIDHFLPTNKNPSPTVFPVTQTVCIIGRVPTWLTLSNCSLRFENRKDTSRPAVEPISWRSKVMRMFHIREIFISKWKQ